MKNDLTYEIRDQLVDPQWDMINGKLGSRIGYSLAIVVRRANQIPRSQAGQTRHVMPNPKQQLYNGA